MGDSIKELLAKHGQEPDFDFDEFVKGMNADPAGNTPAGDGSTDPGTQLPTTTPTIGFIPPEPDPATSSEGPSTDEGAGGDGLPAVIPEPPAPQPNTVTLSQADYDKLNAYQARLRELEAVENQRKAAEQVQQREAVIEASIPDFIDREDKATYELWRSQKELEMKITQDQAQAREQQKIGMLREAATRAATDFIKRYPNLENSDVETIVQRAGQSTFARTILDSSPADAIEGFGQLLDATLWQDTDLRSKAIAETEDQQTKRAQASKERKGKLGALQHGGTPTTVKQAHAPSRSNYSGTGMMSATKDRVTRELADQIASEFNRGGVR